MGSPTRDARPVLVTGATGGQGGRAAIQTLELGIGVRARSSPVRTFARR